jgi:hypothetical protein
MLDRMKSFIFLLNYPKAPTIQPSYLRPPFAHALADFWVTYLTQLQK